MSPNFYEEHLAELPKLCINCKHIGRNGSGDALKFKCFAPANIRCEKMDLVTGDKYKIFRHETCYLARQGYDGTVDSCGADGKWFEEKPPAVPEPMPAKIQPAGKYVAADLLSQLDKMP